MQQRKQRTELRLQQIQQRVSPRAENLTGCRDWRRSGRIDRNNLSNGDLFNTVKLLRDTLHAVIATASSIYANGRVPMGTRPLNI